MYYSSTNKKNIPYNRVEAEREIPVLEFVKRVEVIYRNIVCIVVDTVKKTLLK